MSEHIDNVGPEPKTPSTPSRKRKRGIHSRSPSTQTATEFKSHRSGLPSLRTGPPTDSDTKTDSRFPEAEQPTADKLIPPDALGSLSPRASAAYQLSHLAIEEGVVDGAFETSEASATAFSRPSSSKDSDDPTFRFTLQSTHGSLGDEDATTPPAKRILPPRGIKSPRPRFKSSPYVPPEPPRTTSDEYKKTEQENDWGYNLRSLTWQDSEITGHLLLDPDDDGEGINGIGFRPTPAMAFERSERRKRQVSEWRSRQAQDERERRAERRRRARAIFSKMDMPGQSSLPKKVVRFSV
jgi:hypothetical protein